MKALESWTVRISIVQSDSLAEFDKAILIIEFACRF